MRPRKKTLALVMVLALIVVALSSAFSGIASNPLLNRPLNGANPTIVPEPPPSFLDMNMPTDSTTVLFTVTGAGGLNYLRTGVYATYTGDGWSGYTEEFRDYEGGSTIDVDTSPSASYIRQSVYVQPVLTMVSTFPIAKDTYRVILEEDLDLSYGRETQTMKLGEKLTSPYRVDFYLPRYNEEALRAAPAAPDDRYLEVPASLSAQLADLADLIAKGAGSSYEKALAVEQFLESNYIYDRAFAAPPEGTDPMEYFLFTSKEGICTHFNTAFVLLLRSMDIPARIVSGYLLDPDAYEQAVVPIMAHAYAEIKLEGVGWVLFDATAAAVEEPEDPVPEDLLPSIIGGVYADDNENGAYDQGEAGLSGRTVVLSNRSGGTVSVVQTNAGGTFTFTGVKPGEYSVSVSARQGWRPTTPELVNVTVEEMQPVSITFGAISECQQPPPAGEDPDQPGSWPWELLIPLIIAPLVAAGAMYYRRRSGPPPAAGAASYLHAATPSGPSPYAISFPQIIAPLPEVWGAGEPLEVEVRGAGGSVAVSVDGRDARTVDLKEGATRLVLDLPRGEHAIVVSGDRGRSERKVRVVEYREEVSRLYREALESWKASWPEVRDDLTPREVASVLAAKIEPDRSEGLEASAALLEQAGYSTHPMTRKEFSTMHHALAQVKG